MNNDMTLKSKNGFVLTEKAYRPNMQNTETILSAILDLYKDFFGANSIKPFSVISDPASGDVRTHRESNTIFIDCVYVYWAQIAYQFCHELCHYMIPTEVIKPLRWLEESVCELASLFFMDRLAEYWKSHKLLNAPDYGEEIARYATSTKSDLCKFDLLDLANPTSEISCAFLAANGEYDRPKNRWIALCLLDIFQRRKELWQAVPYLCDVVTQDGLLSELLLDWRSKSPESTRSGINEIATLFIPGGF